ncbi:MAG: DNA repair protein RecN, partial [Clostridia bacterium]|nr:DNA repair protein RecN [Clostridia bacterium]
MLVQLNINGIALIDRLTMEFDDKFNVLTGETGAGKSIIIDAVSLLLGARAQNELIRTNCEKARVEGMFIVPPNHPVEEILSSYDLEFDTEERTLILTREIAVNGKNTCRVNNRLVTLGILKEIGKQLVNIYGQHDFQSLSQSENHIFLLDSLGKEDFQNLLKKVEEAYSLWKSLRAELDHLKKSAGEKAQKIDILQYQVNEIMNINPQQNEDEEIAAELKLLDNWEKISSVVNEGYELIYGHDSAYDKLSKANVRLNEIIVLNNNFGEISNNLQTAIYYIEDAARALKSFGEDFNYDPERKEYLQERKYQIDKLKKKYGGSIKDVIDFKDKAEAELSRLMESEFLIEDYEKKVEKCKEQYQALAEELSQARKAIAETFEEELKNQLKALSMPNTEFSVNIDKNEPTSRGIDKVEFLISPNPGEPLKPLARIASGGEMSRLMLALKVIVAKAENLTTLIFDEIDTGIGGEIVLKVAEKLYQVAKFSQVLCVTHSPHIASLAHRHFKIFKI